MAVREAVAVLLVSVAILHIVAAQETCGMTPRTLQEDFLGSCESLVMRLNRPAVDCNQAWLEFSGAFAGVSPENVTSSNYEAYFNTLQVMVMANETLFWTRTLPLVRILSMMNAMGVRVVSSVSDTILSSAIINSITPESGNISWCGNQGGIDYESNCLCSVTREFWERFSIEFAEAASGDVFYLTDGQAEGGAFRNSSFFSRVELPSLRDSSVTRLIALIIHEDSQGDSCSSPSVEMLRNRIQNNRGFTFDCYDIFGRASDPGQTEALASCIQKVVDNVQEGTEGPKQIPCGGATSLQLSVMLILSALFVHIYN